MTYEHVTMNQEQFDAAHKNTDQKQLICVMAHQLADHALLEQAAKEIEGSAWESDLMDLEGYMAESWSLTGDILNDFLENITTGTLFQVYYQDQWWWCLHYKGYHLYKTVWHIH